MSVLIVGVGAMGGAIAARLLESGLEVCGVDPFVVRALAGYADEATTPEGVRVFRDVTVAAKSLPEPPSDVLIFVRMPEQVAEVLAAMGEHPFFARVPAAILSTLAPGDARDLFTRFGGARPLAETPVSGGVDGARAGSLTVLAHGPTGDWLAAAAGRILRFDEPGQPAIAKLLNNLLAAANVHALAAVLLSAEDLGLGAARMMEIVGHSSGASWMTPHFENFPIELLWKDVQLLGSGTPARVPGLSGESDFGALIAAARDALRR